jgi:hypothetical protein
MVTDTIEIGQSLARGEQIVSSNGLYRAVMQHDGNFVVYNEDKAIWASKTYGKGDRVVLQYDGNLVVYDGTRATWSSGTYKSDAVYLKM